MSLKRQLLQYLHDHGPTTYTMLSIRFDPNMTEAASVLLDLKESHYIELDDKGRVRITPAGMQLLPLLP